MVINRHDVLRTAILWDELPHPVQVVCRRVELPVSELILDEKQECLQQVLEWIRPERQRMSLQQAPMVRLQVAADPRGPGWYVLLQMHHIVSDATSSKIVVSEIVSHLEGRAKTLPESVSYRNHVAQALTYARSHDAAAYFGEKLHDVTEPTAPFGLLDVRGDGSQITESHADVGIELSGRVRAGARRMGVSAATLFHAGWALVVSRTSGQSDVVFGTVLLGRLQGSAGAQRGQGMFINTLPLRVPLQDLTARSLVERTHRELADLFSYEQASLAEAQQCSGIRGGVPLFTTLLNYRHGSARADVEWSSAAGIQVVARHDRTNYPITISVDDLGDEFKLTAQTDRLIDPARIVKVFAKRWMRW